MKFSIAFCLVVISAESAAAWTVPQQRRAALTTSLQANTERHHPWFGAVAAVTGWTLATQIASATPMEIRPSPEVAQDYPTTLVAAGAYIPEESFSSLDMKMPSYDVDKNADLLGGPASSSPDSRATEKKAPKASKKKELDPEKEAARLAAAKDKAEKQAERDAAQAAAKKAKTIAEAEKKAAILEKMAAKKAERAAYQQKRTDAST